MSNATPLPGTGSYVGRLDPTFESDWYRLAASPGEGFCAEAVVSTSSMADATLGRGSGLSPKLVRQVRPGDAVGLAFTGVDLTDLRLGLEGYVTSGSGLYTFALDVLDLNDLGSGDGGSGRDAGPDAASAVPVPRPCFGGQLKRSQGDLVDVYAFQATAGEALGISVPNLGGASPISVDLFSPTEQMIARVNPGELVQTLLDEAGTYTLSVSAASGTWTVSYIIGLTDGPEPPPCRPHCLTL